MSINEVKITPQTKWALVDLGEIWRYRELFYIFAWRDIKVKYKQTVFGVLWVILQPIVSMTVFTIFFGKLAKIPSGNLPYALFVLSGLVFWNYFSNSLSYASDSMVANEGIIKKVYFPKIVLPLSSVVTSLVDFSINLIVLIIIAMFLGFIPQIWIFVVIPVAVVLTALTAIGLGLFLASINAKYRDVRYILPFFIQLLLFLTPIIYPLSIVSEKNKYLMVLNPMTTVIELVRWVFSGTFLLNYTQVIISIMSITIILFIGIWYFHKTEQFFADVV